ncbi:MAG: hypothetical protein U0871_26500 [Gemmataceae bacterium]
MNAPAPGWKVTAFRTNGSAMSWTVASRLEVSPAKVTAVVGP